jgi:hypothetical protein
MRKTWDILPEFRTWRVGPFLAYNVGQKDHLGWEMLFTVLKEVPQKGTVLLIFGEIDCRAHLVKQRDKQGRTLEDLTAECAKSYFGAVTVVKDMGYKVTVFGGIPTGYKDTISEDQEGAYKFYYYGTARDRNKAARLFDFSVKNECEELGVGFLSIFDGLVDENGDTREEYFMDTVHLSQKAMPLIKERLPK